MIEVNIPQDIREFEPTLVGPLSTRKFLCGIVGITLVYGIYAAEKAAGIDPMTVPIFLLGAILPACIGWVKPYGMTFEKFIVKAVRDNVLMPNKIPYKIENMWDEIIKDEAAEAESMKSAEEIKKEKQEAAKKAKASRQHLPQDLRSYH